MTSEELGVLPHLASFEISVVRANRGTLQREIYGSRSCQNVEKMPLGVMRSNAYVRIALFDRAVQAAVAEEVRPRDRRNFETMIVFYRKKR